VTVESNDSARKYWGLYLYDSQSTCWYAVTSGDSDKTRIPSPTGTYAIIWKEIISDATTCPVALYRDILSPTNFLEKIPKDKQLRLHLAIPPHLSSSPNNYVKAYHGTSITSLESILLNGLLVPGDRSGTGKTIEIPREHAQRDLEYNNIQGWGKAIFLTPVSKYARLPVYASNFTLHYEGIPRHCNMILECMVEKSKYTAHGATTKVGNDFREEVVFPGYPKFDT